MNLINVVITHKFFGTLASLYHNYDTLCLNHFHLRCYGLRLVHNMMQGFALRCVATGSAYKMIWMTMQRRNRNFFLFLMFKSFCMHFWSQRNAAQILASYYKPAFTVSRLISTKINVGIYHYVIDTISAAVLCKFSYKMTYLSCLHFVQFHYFLSPSRCLPLFLNLSSLYKSFLLPTTLSSSLSP